MEGRKRETSRIQIIVGIGSVVATLLGASTLNNILIPILNSPNLVIDMKNNKSDAIINIQNKGKGPATHLILTLNAPNTIRYHSIFSTENYTNLTQSKPQVLQIYIPRFIEGEGSIISLSTSIYNRSLTTNSTNNYKLYLTYDQGSNIISASLTKDVQKTESAKNQLTDTSVIVALITTIGGVVGTITSAIISQKQKRTQDKDRSAEKIK